MLLNKHRLLELSDKISDILVKKGYTNDEVKPLTINDISKYSEDVFKLFDDPEGLYDAFHEEETFSYFKSLLLFDVAFKNRING